MCVNEVCVCMKMRVRVSCVSIYEILCACQSVVCACLRLCVCNRLSVHVIDCVRVYEVVCV